MSKFKMARLLRDSLFQRSTFIKASGDLNSFRSIASQAGVSVALPQLKYSSAAPTTNPKFGSNVKIFAPYTIFKGKAALSAQMLLPTFAVSDYGGYEVERSGVIMLTFWPSSGIRKYDWNKRQNFALSVTEVGALISLGSKGSCEFFHDPSMKSSNAGQVTKSLSVKAHDDGSGNYFISLSVMNNLLKTNDRLAVPVTAAEFAVLRAAFTFALPQLLGWDQFKKQLPLSSSQTTRSISKPVGMLAGSEWDR